MKCAIFAVILAVAAYFLPHAWQKTYKVHASGGVLVTGASTGIGRHAALTIAAQTNFIVFAGVRKTKDAVSLQAEAEKNALQVIPVILDVTNQTQVDAVRAEILAKLGDKPFVGLLNNAGVSVSLPIELLSVDAARWVFDVNFFGQMRVTKAFLPELRNAQGRILFTNSILGHVVAPGFGVYSESKYALKAFAMQLRMELADFGVSVSSLSPGIINTELGANTAANTAASGSDADSAIMQLYPQYLACQAEILGPALAQGESCSSMDHGLLDALVGPTPKVEYFSSNFAGVPVTVLAGLQWVLPTRLHELLTEKDKQAKAAEFAGAECMAKFRSTAPKTTA